MQRWHRGRAGVAATAAWIWAACSGHGAPFGEGGGGAPGQGATASANADAAGTTAESTSGTGGTGAGGAGSTGVDGTGSTGAGGTGGTGADGSVAALDATVASSLPAAVAFLYSGVDPVQTGVAPGTIDVPRAAVIRGRVLGIDGAPLPGVTVTVHAHPEYGSTHTLADGSFAMVVNGGGPLVVRYEAAGHLSLSRQLDMPWQDYAMAPDVVLTPVDPQVTVVDLAGQTGVVAARGSAITDADGARQVTVLVPPGTAAAMILPGGAAVPLTTVSLRATEYTVGEHGPAAMPATLPPASGYTYAVELSVDEAMAAGAVSVEFSAPLPFYVENFLEFPVGATVPAGYYDRERGVWVAGTNGRVIEVLDTSGGLAALDGDGDGLADGAAALAALGISEEERETLAQLYTAGQTLWRVPIQHFTPWDLNWPYGPPEDACMPLAPACAAVAGDPGSPGGAGGSGGGGNGRDPHRPAAAPDTCEESGSIIECDNQVLGEALPIAGTPLALHYRSDRVPGHLASYTLQIPLAHGGVPPSLQRIEWRIEIAGRRFENQLPCPCPPDHTVTFVWDGLDTWGRRVQGEQPATVRIGYVYEGVYMDPPAFAAAFGAWSSAEMTGNPTRQEVTLWKSWRGGLGGMNALPLGLGGWTLSAHHFYSPSTGVLYLGDGRRRRADAMDSIITTVAGSGCIDCALGDGGPATQANLDGVSGVAVGPDGSVYLSDTFHDRVRRVAPEGVISTLAGDGTPGSAGDGGPAALAQLHTPRGLAVGPDGSVYIAEQGGSRIRQVRPDGTITTVAGTGAPGHGGDGGPATQAQLASPFGVAVAPDGALFMADTGNHRIRRVGTDGVITTVAGDEASGFAGDDGPATLARLKQPRGVAVAPDGGLLIVDTDNNRVRRVGPNGIITTFAGTGQAGSSGDGGLATEAQLQGPMAALMAPDGALTIADHFGYRLRQVVSDRVIRPLAGIDALVGPIREGAPAGDAAVLQAAQLALGPDGALYVAEMGDGARRVRRIAPPRRPLRHAGNLLIPAEDGREAYVFDSAGRHLRTLDARTSATLHEMHYGPAGRLAAIEDADGDLTTITRDAAGHPLAITGPFGQTTQLATNTEGYLALVNNPAGEAVTLAYGAGGLLTSLTDALGRAHTFTFDADGRLSVDEDPAGGSKTLTRASDGSGNSVTVTTALGRATTYSRLGPAMKALGRSIALPSGLSGAATRAPDSTVTTTLPDGRVLAWSPAPDPRFGMLAPFATSETLATPGGRTLSISRSRSVELLDPADLWSFSSLAETTTVNNRSFLEIFTKATRTLTRTTPAGRIVTTTLDEAGRVVKLELPGVLPVNLTYDAHGRLAMVAQGPRTRTRAYGPDGWLASVTDAVGQVRAFASDPVGRVLEETRPDGEAALFGYDAAGNGIAVTPPGQPAHLFGFNGVDQVASYNPPPLSGGPTPTTWSRDLDHRLTHLERPGGVSLGHARDAAGRLGSVSWSGGAVTRTHDDATGKLATLTGPAGVTLSFGYDGHLLTDVSWSGAIAGALHRDFNDDLRVTSETVNGAAAVSFGYDADGLLTSAGGLTLTRGPQNGRVTGTSLGVVVEALSYNPFGEPEQRTVTANGAALLSVSHVRDALGRITEKTESIAGETHTEAYVYDLAGRLGEVHRDGALAAHHSYDENGSRIGRVTATETIAGAVDEQDRLLSWGALTFTYEASGELATRTNTATGEVTLYSYDPLGNLRQVSLPGGTLVEYVVDGLGRRVGKRVDGVVVRGWLYSDTLRPAAELNDSGAVVARFLYGERANVPEGMIRGGTTYRIITDHLGSVRLVVDAATGAVAQRMDYDELGRVVLDTSPGLQPFGFAGGLYDPDTELVRFGARDYDPETGRWTAKDPLLFEGGDTNLYAYALGDPINNADPTGKSATVWEVLVGIGAAAEAPMIVGTGVVGICILLALTLDDDLADEDDPERCQELLVECLENPQQPGWNRKLFGDRKDCGACFRQCVKYKMWPDDKCPT